MRLSLRALRINFGWSREEASKKFGICVDTLSNYENYKTFPDVIVINNILKATNLKYEDIDFINELNIKKNNKG